MHTCLLLKHWGEGELKTAWGAGQFPKTAPGLRFSLSLGIAPALRGSKCSSTFTFSTLFSLFSLYGIPIRWVLVPLMLSQKVLKLFSFFKKMCFIIYFMFKLPWWFNDEELACQCRRCGFNPWVRTVPWKREWQPTPGFLPGESHGQKEPGGL